MLAWKATVPCPGWLDTEAGTTTCGSLLLKNTETAPATCVEFNVTWQLAVKPERMFPGEQEKAVGLRPTSATVV